MSEAHGPWDAWFCQMMRVIAAVSARSAVTCALTHHQLISHGSAIQNVVDHQPKLQVEQQQPWRRFRARERMRRCACLRGDGLSGGGGQQQRVEALLPRP
jgi:hypothetical protein